MTSPARITITGRRPPRCKRCDVVTKRRPAEAVSMWRARKFCSVECSHADQRAKREAAK